MHCGPSRSEACRAPCRVQCGHKVEDSRPRARAAAGLPTLVIAGNSDRRGWPSQVGFIERLSDLLEMLRTY